tara:strand:+ start:2211 stop:2750 length:540 start_codon:yes stop_codon:yes gene_type:complete
MAVDIQEVNTRVRFLLGGADETVISDIILNGIIQGCIDNIGTEDEFYCEIVYCSLLETLRYLIRHNQMNSGITGNQRKRKEQNGKRTIEVEFGDSSDVVLDGWKAMYEDFLSNPSWVCEELSPKGGINLVLIGGVSEKEYQRVKNDPDSRNAYQTSIQKQYDAKTVHSVRRRSNLRRWI